MQSTFNNDNGLTNIPSVPGLHLNDEFEQNNLVYSNQVLKDEGGSELQTLPSINVLPIRPL